MNTYLFPNCVSISLKESLEPVETIDADLAESFCNVAQPKSYTLYGKAMLQPIAFGVDNYAKD